MKRLIIGTLLFITAFFGITQIHAETVLHTKQISEGVIDVSIDFERGYVGGIHVTIPVTGDVELESITWNSSLSNEYTKKYSYQNRMISVVITTGNSAKNLLDKNGTLKIGTFHFKNMKNDKETFSLKLNEFTMVDAAYKSVHISEVETIENHYDLKATQKPDDSNSSDDDNEQKPIIPTPDTPNSGDENFNFPDNPSNVTGGNPSQSTDTDEIDDIPTDEDDGMNNISPGDNEDEKTDSKDDPKEPTNSIEEKKKKPNYFLIGLGVVGGFSLIVFVIYVGKTNKL